MYHEKATGLLFESKTKSNKQTNKHMSMRLLKLTIDEKKTLQKET